MIFAHPFLVAYIYYLLSSCGLLSILLSLRLVRNLCSLDCSNFVRMLDLVLMMNLLLTSLLVDYGLSLLPFRFLILPVY